MFDSTIITSTTSKVQLTNADWDYVSQRHIALSKGADNKAPQLLIGCEHLSELVEGKNCKLPSRLHFITTKFGCMVSGRMAKAEAQTPTPQQTMLTQNDIDTWGRCWFIESSGTNEFTGTEKCEKRIVDEKNWYDSDYCRHRKGLSPGPLTRRRQRSHKILVGRDSTQPLKEDNIVVYRFTRVRFGLNSSPFLLAATIYSHLESSSVKSRHTTTQG